MTDPQDLLKDGAEVYEQKNDDYGDSWRLAGEILYLMSGGEPITIRSAEDWIQIGLYTRRMDKLVRTFNGEFRADELNFESIRETHSDEMVYAAMAAALSDVRGDLQ